MNSYQQVYGMTAAGIEGGGTGSGGSNQNLKFRSSSHQLLQQAKVTIPQAILQVLFYCCRANGLLAKFPSRAKRIDVLSRFIFPLIFAIFNLAYWLYYLLAKNNFSGSKLAWWTFYEIVLNHKQYNKQYLHVFYVIARSKSLLKEVLLF